MKKDFDSWIKIKKKSHAAEFRAPFKEREVWWCKFGANVGDEQDGKGSRFLRPVLIVRKFNKRIFVGLPFSTVIKENNLFYHQFEFKGKKQSVIISQIRLLDSKRLEERMGSIGKMEFDTIKEKSMNLIFR